MAALRNVHPSDTDLERRYMGMVKDKREVTALEKHLDGCPSCVKRTKEVEWYVKVVRVAFKRLG
jgi:hypothetical protein